MDEDEECGLWCRLVKREEERGEGERERERERERDMKLLQLPCSTHPIDLTLT
jgi:hypothetical protein